MGATLQLGMMNILGENPICDRLGGVLGRFSRESVINCIVSNRGRKADQAFNGTGWLAGVFRIVRYLESGCQIYRFGTKAGTNDNAARKAAIFTDGWDCLGKRHESLKEKSGHRHEQRSQRRQVYAYRSERTHCRLFPIVYTEY